MKKKVKKIVKGFANLISSEIVEIINRYFDLMGEKNLRFYKNTPESIEKILWERGLDTIKNFFQCCCI